MENLGRKAAVLAAVCVAVVAVGTGYYYRNDILYEINERIMPDRNTGEVRLKDDYGNRYSLINHGDGTESALYDNDRAVTFTRTNEGSLVWQYGSASLLAPIAANYFAFYGMKYSGGIMDVATMTLRPDAPLTALDEADTGEKNSAVHRGSHTYTGIGRSRSRDYDRKSRKADGVTRKSGFGSAGARSHGSGHGG